jgi:hypothetical protein
MDGWIDQVSLKIMDFRKKSTDFLPILQFSYGFSLVAGAGIPKAGRYVG